MEQTQATTDYDYDVCLSFAGEDREYVRRVANELQRRGVRCFYDEHEQVQLWGVNLYDHLYNIYGSRARFCVMFISTSYPSKMWTDYERRVTQDRDLRDQGKYILPVRFDDTPVTGVLSTIGYLDLRTIDPDKLVDIIEEKLGRNPRSLLEFVFVPNKSPYIQRDHMWLKFTDGRELPTNGATYRVGVHNRSSGTIDNVHVELTSVHPPPRFDILPLVLRCKDDNFAPYTRSQAFSITSGSTVHVDVLMKSEETQRATVQHIAGQGVRSDLLPDDCMITLTCYGDGVAPVVNQYRVAIDRENSLLLFEPVLLLAAV
jgi:hypothetical protein